MQWTTELLLFCICIKSIDCGRQKITGSGFSDKSIYWPSSVKEINSRGLSKYHYRAYKHFVPYLFDDIPAAFAGVTYYETPDYISSHETNIEAEQGVLVNNSDTVRQPALLYLEWENTFFTIMMIDFDFPSREAPIYRSWLHWLVVNVNESYVEQGDTIADYVGTWPEKGTGIHRYVVIIYLQQYKLNATLIKHYPKNNVIARRNFNNTLFALKWGLKTEDICMNYFTAKHCDFVDQHYKHLIVQNKNHKTS